ncbi:hypothetical protein JD969_12395 [Planctomycetota bacterium]|nr:hypothetical protein JD969_12395 [Planctomycetota bacterium]
MTLPVALSTVFTVFSGHIQGSHVQQVHAMILTFEPVPILSDLGAAHPLTAPVMTIKSNNIKINQTHLAKKTRQTEVAFDMKNPPLFKIIRLPNNMLDPDDI